MILFDKIITRTLNYTIKNIKKKKEKDLLTFDYLRIK